MAEEATRDDVSVENVDTTEAESDNQATTKQPQTITLTVDELNAMVNKAITTHVKRLERKLVPTASPQQPETKADANTESLALKKLEQQQRELEARLSELHSREKNAKVSAALKETLIKKDVGAVEIAFDYLVSKKQVEVDETGDVVFKAEDGTVYDLETGIDNWIKTNPNAKYLLKNKGLSGTGERIANSKPNQPKQISVFDWIMQGREGK